jgi:solute carrier family 25 thiamine pyrophosphate transporter 19
LIYRVVIAPLDVVKIRMQLQTHRTHFGFNRNKKNTVVKYNKITQALQIILKEEGIKVIFFFLNFTPHLNMYEKLTNIIGII